MVAVGWRRWSDLYVDFGNQLYVPWQIVEGQVLYRDLFYVFGPLSSYLHAFIFSITGPGMIYLAMFNLLLTFLLALIIYRIFMKLGGTLTATLAALMFLTVHGLGYHKYFGNYNFVQPYSHELAHGIFLSFCAIWLFINYLEAPKPARLAGIGLMLGLVFLTKIEVMVALGPAIVLGLVAGFRAQGLSREAGITRLLLVFGMMSVPALGFLFYFALEMPILEAGEYLIGPWMLALNSQLHDLYYYQFIKGTDKLAENLLDIGQFTACFLVLAGLLIAITTQLERYQKNNYFYAMLVISPFLGLILYFFHDIPWKFFLFPLPVITLCTVLYQSVPIIKNDEGKEELNRILGIWVLAIFSLLMLLKIFFRSHIYHYGFALTIPGSLLTLLVIFIMIPGMFKEKMGNGAAYRFTAGALVLFYICAMNFDSYLFFSRKSFPISRGADMYYDYRPLQTKDQEKIYEKGMIVQAALEFINENIEKDAEIAFIPDAIMLNYLSRHRDPAKGFILNPVTLLLFDNGKSYLEDLKKANPPYVVLIDRYFPEFNMIYFGKDYAQDVHAWIQKNYSPHQQIGATPFTASGFGIQILKRNPA